MMQIIILDGVRSQLFRNANLAKAQKLAMEPLSVILVEIRNGKYIKLLDKVVLVENQQCNELRRVVECGCLRSSRT